MQRRADFSISTNLHTVDLNLNDCGSRAEGYGRLQQVAMPDCTRWKICDADLVDEGELLVYVRHKVDYGSLHRYQAQS